MLAVLLYSLFGCAEWDAARRSVGEYGSQAADRSVDDAKWFLCNAATVGSIKRKFGANQESADAYNTLCPRETGEAPVITGEDNGAEDVN